MADKVHGKIVRLGIGRYSLNMSKFEERIEKMDEDEVILPKNGQKKWMRLTPSLLAHHWKHDQHAGPRTRLRGYHKDTR
jgi:hypothetical protein